MFRCGLVLVSTTVFGLDVLAGQTEITPSYDSTAHVADPVLPNEPNTLVTSVGYMSHYIGDGVVFGENTLWAGLDWSHTQSSVSAGAFYYRSNGGFVDEQLELYAAYTHEVGSYVLSWGAGAYYLPNEVDDRGWDLSMTVNRSISGLDLSAGARYDFVVLGWFMQSSAGHNINLGGAAQLYISGGVNYQLDYWREGWRSNDGFLRTSLFWQPLPELNVEVYLARLFALRSVEIFQDDVTHAGVSLSLWL